MTHNHFPLFDTVYVYVTTTHEKRQSFYLDRYDEIPPISKVRKWFGQMSMLGVVHTTVAVRIFCIESFAQLTK